jgi:hypothetical protein
MNRKAIAIAAIMATTAASLPAKAGGILGELLFGSLDSTQSGCQAQYPGNYKAIWQCIRGRVAQGHTGDMRNSATPNIWQPEISSSQEFRAARWMTPKLSII